MGCLKNFIGAILLTVIVMGFMAFGGNKNITNWLNNIIHPSHDTVIERAQKVGDFSRLDKEFEIEKAAGVMGYNAVLAEHKASGQKMIVVDSGKKAILTQEDIKSDNAEAIIKDAINKFKYQTAAIEEFHVTDKGVMNSYGGQVPYVKFTAKLKKLPIGEVLGIISVAKDENGKDKVLISLNRSDKYSQLITNEFFKSVK